MLNNFQKEPCLVLRDPALQKPLLNRLRERKWDSMAVPLISLSNIDESKITLNISAVVAHENVNLIAIELAKENEYHVLWLRNTQRLNLEVFKYSNKILNLK